MKTTFIPFWKIRPFQYFRFEGRVYMKVYNGQSLDERNGHDAILALHDKVEPLYQCRDVRHV